MKCLTITTMPGMEEATKDKDNNVSVYGAAIAKTEMVRALLLHGSFDRYYFISDSLYSAGEVQDILSSYPNHEKVRVVLLDDFHQLREINRMVFFAGDASLSELAYLRASQGRSNWPVTGITHALSHARGINMALSSFFAGLQEYDCLVCTSHAGRQAVEKIIQRLADRLSSQIGVALKWKVKLPVIPLGIDASLYQPRDKQAARDRLMIPPGHTVFLYIGRFSAASKMDPFPLILSFHQTLAAHKRDVLLILAGDDTVYHMTSQIKYFAGTLGIADKVRILPNIKSEEKLLLYSAADVFISPSDSVQETFGLTIIEAMGCGLPVIASDWNGYRESVVHGETGLLVPTHMADCTDYVSRMTMLKADPAIHWMLGQAVSVDMAEMGKSMQILYENPELRERMADRARRRVLDNYDWLAVVRKYEDLWSDMLDRALNDESCCSTDVTDSVFSHDYFNVFEHYATVAITAATDVRITHLGRVFVNGDIRIRPLATDVVPFTAKLTLQIATSCQYENSIPVAELIENMRKSSDASDEIIFHHIARLVKYGILEVSPGEGPREPIYK
jgi:D-inositol-3-phosphate glycosyltransferase